MWIGFDDTDSKKGGCTTYVATEIIKALDYDIINFPRLVRLNPNIPWKTRGNGAIAIQVGKGYGEKIKIGEIEGRDIYGYTNKKRDIPEHTIVKILDEIISTLAQNDAQPAFIVTEKKLPYNIYSNAVKELVIKEDIINELPDGAQYKLYNGGRGIIGAAAAIAWRPLTRTFELITYGEKKALDVGSVKKMDKLYSSTFNNYDYNNDYIALLPKSTTPVFYGIRGVRWSDLHKAKKTLIASKEDRWIIYETNQGTDNHLQRKKISEIFPFQSVIVTGKVVEKPKTIVGGHVIFKISDGKTIDCAAYEPTKEFRHIVRQLEIGDIIVAYGGVKTAPLTINIEKIKIKKLVDIRRKKENPVCSSCGRRMKSIGKNKGYRCQNCHIKINEEHVSKFTIKRKIIPGLYEVPVIARRHLAKPLKLLKNKDTENQ